MKFLSPTSYNRHDHEVTNMTSYLGFNLLHVAFYVASMSGKFVTDAIKNEIKNGTQDQGSFSILKNQ